MGQNVKAWESGEKSQVEDRNRRKEKNEEGRRGVDQSKKKKRLGWRDRSTGETVRDSGLGVGRIGRTKRTDGFRQGRNLGLSTGQGDSSGHVLGRPGGGM